MDDQIMPGKNVRKLNLSVNEKIVEAIDREKGNLTRSAFVGDLLWFALLATPDQLKAMEIYTEAIKAEK